MLCYTTIMKFNKLPNLTRFIASAPLPPWRRILSKLALVSIIIVSFLAGFYTARPDVGFSTKKFGSVIGRNKQAPNFLSQDVSFDMFWDVWQLINREYVDRPVPDIKLYYGALAGLVAGVGDPYTVFLDPKVAKEFNTDLSGSFEGIGAEIGMRNGQIVVIAPLTGTPAEKAGIKAGDLILSIDGIDTTGLTVENAVTKIRGEKGTSVMLQLIRPEDEKSFEVKVMRDTIIVKSVEYKELKSTGGKKIVEIHISHFNEDTSLQFRSAIDKSLPLNPDGIVLDLRNNPGGFLDVGVEIASYWIEQGVVVIEQGDQKIEHSASGSSPLSGIPTIVLVNKGSASASEIVAGALQDYKLAKVVGEKTFGKGSVQALRPFPDGSAIKITVARWLTPLGRSIDQAGIEPDELASPEAEETSDKDEILLKAVDMFDR